MQIETDPNNTITLKVALISLFNKQKLPKYVELTSEQKKIGLFKTFPNLTNRKTLNFSTNGSITKYLSFSTKLYPTKYGNKIEEYIALNTYFESVCIEYLKKICGTDLDEKKCIYSKKKANEILSSLESTLIKNQKENQKYLICEQITVIDLIWWCTLYPIFSEQGLFLKALEDKKEIISNYSNLYEWFQGLFGADKNLKQLLKQSLEYAKFDTTGDDFLYDYINRLVLFGHCNKPKYQLTEKPQKTVYITTPIYYVNGVPHIGHIFTTLLGDILYRWYKLRNIPVKYLTGTDEHGIKIQQTAAKLKITPKQLADQNSSSFKKSFKDFNITYDRFIRTTDEDHEEMVVKVWKKLDQAGLIYKGKFEGWYSVGDETYVVDRDIEITNDKDGNEIRISKESGHVLKWTTEENYLFKLSEFQEPLLNWFEQNPKVISPSFRQKEIVDFVKGGLNDLSISRTAVSWGIPVPDDPNHTIYVWIDALTNYLTYAGIPDEVKERGEMPLFPPEYQLMGKDILKFHSVYWPAFLMAMGLPLPKKIIAHGWWTKDKKKISKSLGNAFEISEVVEKFGLDPLRYFLFRESTLGADGDYSENAMTSRLNNDLADTFGNLVIRSTSQSLNPKRCVPEIDKNFFAKEDNELISMLNDLRGVTDHFILNCQFNKALTEIFDLIKACNKYVVEQKPWVLKKSQKDEDQKRLSIILYTIIEVVRVVGTLLLPFMPQTCERLLNQLGVKPQLWNVDSCIFGLRKAGEPFSQDTSILFKKYEPNKVYKKKNPKKKKK
ncbi:methionyl-tRNA synthetase [Anaeramoeba flamelloides]|uniref:methionine--tRNA ligase n=1 Tax=Anaeramoeba flamelloides TaxID=1746091 RepID=A0ABQ8YL79_9EUKA|nr:methionyl-tRNA synthetase [Anaeramoeba flamelloides]